MDESDEVSKKDESREKEGYDILSLRWAWNDRHERAVASLQRNKQKDEFLLILQGRKST